MTTTKKNNNKPNERRQLQLHFKNIIHKHIFIMRSWYFRRPPPPSRCLPKTYRNYYRLCVCCVSSIASLSAFYLASHVNEREPPLAFRLSTVSVDFIILLFFMSRTQHTMCQGYYYYLRIKYKTRIYSLERERVHAQFYFVTFYEQKTLIIFIFYATEYLYIRKRKIFMVMRARTARTLFNDWQCVCVSH